MSVKAAEVLPQVHRTMLDAAILDMYAREYPDSMVAEVLKAGMSVMKNGIAKLPRVDVDLLGEADMPKDTVRSFGKKAQIKEVGKTRKKDVMKTGEWRKEILSFAMSHNGRFDYETFRQERYRPEDHGGVAFSKSRVHFVIAYMVTQLNLLSRLAPGEFELTNEGREAATAASEAGKKEGEEENVEGVVVAPAKKVYANSALMRKNDTMSAAAWREDILSFALAHKGIFSYEPFKTERYREEDHGGVQFSQSKIHPVISELVVRKRWFDRLELGVFKITKAGRQAAAHLFKETAKTRSAHA